MRFLPKKSVWFVASGIAFSSLLSGILFGQPAHATAETQDQSNEHRFVLNVGNEYKVILKRGTTNPEDRSNDMPQGKLQNDLELQPGNQSAENSVVQEPVYETFFMEHPAKGLLICSTDPNVSALCEAVDTSEVSTPVQVQEQELDPIVITESQFMELIPETPQILMDRNGFGLKNGHTNFYASYHKPQSATTTMFGNSVQITATPINFQWDYGDGTTFESKYPGYPQTKFNEETDASHQYQDTGNYTATLTTVFLGSYSINGGPAQAITSTVELHSVAMPVQIYKAETRNVYESCLENPNAWGCDGPNNP